VKQLLGAPLWECLISQTTISISCKNTGISGITIGTTSATVVTTDITLSPLAPLASLLSLPLAHGMNVSISLSVFAPTIHPPFILLLFYVVMKQKALTLILLYDVIK
jgi:hypothetical protein